MIVLQRSGLGLVAAATLASSVAVPATALADDDRQQFQSPSATIRCVLEPSMALCQIEQHAYVVPPDLARDDETGAPCPPGAAGGGDFRLDQGKRGFVRCTDTTTGHFFRVSDDSYELG